MKIKIEKKELSFLSTIRGDIEKHSKDYNFVPTFDIRNDKKISSFLHRKDLRILAKRGVSSPDHVIRIKGNPLVLSKNFNHNEISFNFYFYSIDELSISKNKRQSSN